MTVLKIKYEPISHLIPYVNNSRTHTDAQIKQIASSIQEFGFTNPVLIDDQDMIIAGHGRVLAADLLNIDKIPTIKLTELTEAQKKAYIIADNKLALNSQWDESLLKIELETLAELDFDYSTLGFDSGEISNIFLEKEEGEVDAHEEWSDMPEFNQPNAQSMRHVIVHFDTEEDVKEFFARIGVQDTGKTKSFWFPQKENDVLKDKRYV